MADRLDGSATALALELPAAIHDDVAPMMRAAATALREMPSEAVERLTAEADAVVIPRSAIPDGLVERLETRRGPHRSTQDKIDQIVAARLLSGATEGDER